jgi:hypothetical protein
VKLNAYITSIQKTLEDIHDVLTELYATDRIFFMNFEDDFSKKDDLFCSKYMEERIRLFPKRLPNQNIESEKILFRPPQSIREQLKTQQPHYFEKEITLKKYNRNEIEKKKNYPKTTRKNRELNNISNYNNEPNSNSKTSSKKKEVYLICFKPY